MRRSSGVRKPSVSPLNRKSSVGRWEGAAWQPERRLLYSLCTALYCGVLQGDAALSKRRRGPGGAICTARFRIRAT
eukprot:jgi/Botrbrau1/13101/Bobra.0187s0059.1